MKIFVAGGSGAVGSRLVPLFVAAGHEVTGTSRDPGGVAADRRGWRQWVVMDGRDAASIRPCSTRSPRCCARSRRWRGISTSSDSTRPSRSRTSCNTRHRRAPRCREGGRHGPHRRAEPHGVDQRVRRHRREDRAGPDRPEPGSRVAGTRSPRSRTPSGRPWTRRAGATLRHLLRPRAGARRRRRDAGVRAQAPGADRRRRHRDLVVLPHRRCGHGDLAPRPAVHPASTTSSTTNPRPFPSGSPSSPVAVGAKPPMRVPAWVARMLIGEFGVAWLTTARGSSNAKAKAESAGRRGRDLACGFRTGLGQMSVQAARSGPSTVSGAGSMTTRPRPCVTRRRAAEVHRRARRAAPSPGSGHRPGTRSSRRAAVRIEQRSGPRLLAEHREADRAGRARPTSWACMLSYRGARRVAAAT